LTKNDHLLNFWNHHSINTDQSSTNLGLEWWTTSDEWFVEFSTIALLVMLKECSMQTIKVTSNETNHKTPL